MTDRAIVSYHDDVIELLEPPSCMVESMFKLLLDQSLEESDH